MDVHAKEGGGGGGVAARVQSVIREGTQSVQHAWTCRTNREGHNEQREQ